jgi:hypothetical protein
MMRVKLAIKKIAIFCICTAKLFQLCKRRVNLAAIPGAAATQPLTHGGSPPLIPSFKESFHVNEHPRFDHPGGYAGFLVGGGL